MSPCGRDASDEHRRRYARDAPFGGLALWSRVGQGVVDLPCLSRHRACLSSRAWAAPAPLVVQFRIPGAVVLSIPVLRLPQGGGADARRAAGGVSGLVRHGTHRRPSRRDGEAAAALRDLRFLLLLVPSLAAQMADSLGAAQAASYRGVTQRHDRDAPSLAGRFPAHLFYQYPDGGAVRHQTDNRRVAKCGASLLAVLHPCQRAAAARDIHALCGGTAGPSLAPFPT